MFSLIWNKRRDSLDGFNCKGCEDEGLRILINLSGNENPSSHIKPSSKLIKPIFCFSQITNPTSSSCDNQYYCLIKSCHLCLKFLNLDQEVYMYRGDLGFCSVECRDRQIYLDEMEEIEISTKKIMASFQHRRHDGGRSRCETSNFSKEYRHRRRQAFSSENNNPVIFSYS